MLPNSSYLVRKIGTNKTQFLHRMRRRQFTPRQPLPDKGITPEEWKPNPEVGLQHDDLYTRAWECDYERPVVDAENNNATPPHLPENAVESDLSIEETWNKPGTAGERSWEIFPQTEELCVVTDTFP